MYHNGTNIYSAISRRPPMAQLWSNDLRVLICWWNESEGLWAMMIGGPK